jgi:hypothetical protein
MCLEITFGIWARIDRESRYGVSGEKGSWKRAWECFGLH